MKQKLGVAQAIMEDQDIIVLDEPFNGLDFQTARDIREVITELNKNGKTILLTSHIRSDIDELCDKIYIIEDNQLQVLTKEIEEQYYK